MFIGIIDLFASARCKMRQKLGEMHDAQYSKKKFSMKSRLWGHDNKCFYDALKTGYAPQAFCFSSQLSEDGKNLLTDERQILER